MSREPVPVTVIGGYLGAGKTTLINHLLHNANGMRLAILVNDFGELPIDAALIESQDGDIISLSGGCVCCSYGNDLQAALMQLKETETSPGQVIPDQIVIESSGVALPGAIGASITLLRHLRLHGVVTLTDAATVQETARDKYLGDTIERQLADADIVIVNKTDLVSTQSVNDTVEWISSINPTAINVRSRQGRVAPEIVLDNLFRNAPQDSLPPALSHAHLFESATLVLPDLINPTALAKHLAEQEPSVIRAKGFIQDHDNTMHTIQIVGRRWQVSEAPPGARPGVICIGVAGSIDIAAIQSALAAAGTSRKM